MLGSPVCVPFVVQVLHLLLRILHLTVPVLDLLLQLLHLSFVERLRGGQRQK